MESPVWETTKGPSSASKNHKINQNSVVMLKITNLYKWMTPIDKDQLNHQIRHDSLDTLALLLK